MNQTLLISLSIAGGLLLVGLLAAVLLLRHPAALRRRIESLFRRPPRPPKLPGAKHYYKPYWS